MQLIESFVSDTINGNLWKVIPYLLILAGAYFGIRTIVVQIRMIPEMFRAVAEKPGGRGRTKEESKDDGISAFKAFTISAASRVGTGNVAGVAVAITTGGPGAVFWMWMIALLGGATAFVESTLAQLWKTRDGDTYRGGPAYYMTRGLKARWLAVIFAFAITITYGFVYNAIQTNSIVAAVGGSINSESLSSKMIIGAILAVITAMVIFGGVKRIASFTQVVVPFMAVTYIIIGIVVLALNYSAVPAMITEIVTHALGFKEIAGATLGAAFTNGMKRGLFSNEAGQGSAPNAAATATVSHPVKQGLVQTLGVYFDTIVVCSITAFIILLSDPKFGEGIESSNLTQSALAGEVGAWGVHFVTFILFFLAFSSIIGNTYLAQSNIEYFTTNKSVMTGFRVMVLVCVFGGAIGSVPLVWALGDTFAGIMVFINLLAIVPLAGVAIKLLKNFSQQKARGLDPVFHKDMLPGVPNIECWDGDDAATQGAVERVAEFTVDK